MRNYKQSFILLILSVAAFAVVHLAAQDSLAMPVITAAPEMPQMSAFQSTLEMPSAPDVSAPAISSSWYVPGKTNIKIIPGEKTAAEEAPKIVPSSQEQTVPSIAGTSSVLSSADLASLKKLGLLSQTEGLLSQKNIQISDILSELESIKKTTDLPAYSNYDAIKAAVNPDDAAILRFSINGSDISQNCKNILCSGIEPNGAFLLTGDCKYAENNKLQTETFYLLFTAGGTDGGQTVYTVTPALTQNVVNEKSALYQLSKTDKLQALKTGSIVSIHSETGTLSVDMLLSLGSSNSLFSMKK